MGLLDGKVVLVTGGSRNVGAGIVRSVAREGATVAINCKESIDGANELAQSIERQGGTAGVWRCDVRDPEAVLRMIEDIVKRFGRLDAVINNVGGGAAGKLDELTWDDMLHVYEHDVRPLLNTTKAVVPFMKAQGGGRIVNIMSEQWNEGYGGVAANVSGKGAEVGLSRCLAHELGPDNITVNMVSPGWTRTDRTPEDANESPYAKGTPLRRIAEPEDIGNACVFLISDLACYISGAFIPVNGGRTRQIGS